MTLWKRAKTMTQILGTRELAVTAFLPCPPGHFCLKTTRLLFPSNLLAWIDTLFPKLKNQVERPVWPDTEMIQDKSLLVLNTLWERDFQDAFRKWQNHCVYMQEAILQGWQQNFDQKKIFWKYISTSPGNFGMRFFIQFFSYTYYLSEVEWYTMSIISRTIYVRTKVLIGCEYDD